MVELIENLRGMGAAGAALYFGFFLIANVAFVPATVLTIGGGFVCGFGAGVAVAAAGRPAAAALAFALSRRFARAPAVRLLRRSPHLDALDCAVDRGGLRLVVLLRLSPLLPSTVSNYVLGATRLRFRDFLLGSALGTLPSTVLYAYIGSGIGAAAAVVERERVPASPAERVFFWAGLAATAVVVVTLSRLARAELRRRVGVSPTTAPGDPG